MIRGRQKPAGANSNVLLIVAAVLISSPLLAQQEFGEPASNYRRRIVVSIQDRKLAVVTDGIAIRVFAVAVGASVSPSPEGEFQIVSRLSNPTYYHAGTVVPPGKNNPIGTRWVGLDKKGYGIHGTNVPGSIGQAASHGCIRLRNRDMEQLFAMLRVGDTVTIRAQRDEEIAAIFGGQGEISNITAAQVSSPAALNSDGQ
jgi:L,D-transpeptidase catalytic domain